MELHGQKGFTESEEFVELLRPYLFRTKPIGMFHGMPADVGRKLMNLHRVEQRGWRQNNSPTFAEFVKLAEQFEGTLCGHVIWSNRTDEGLIVDTLIVLESKAGIVEDWFADPGYMPDENEREKGFRRFWWD